MAMQAIVILVLAAVVMDKSKEFNDLDVRPGLYRHQSSVRQKPQPVILAVKATVPNPEACGQKH